jgi:hypothetical protein
VDTAQRPLRPNAAEAPAHEAGRDSGVVGASACLSERRCSKQQHTPPPCAASHRPVANARTPCCHASVWSFCSQHRSTKRAPQPTVWSPSWGDGSAAASRRAGAATLHVTTPTPPIIPAGRRTAVRRARPACCCARAAGVGLRRAEISSSFSSLLTRRTPSSLPRTFLTSTTSASYSHPLRPVPRAPHRWHAPPPFSTSAPPPSLAQHVRTARHVSPAGLVQEQGPVQERRAAPPPRGGAGRDPQAEARREHGQAAQPQRRARRQRRRDGRRGTAGRRVGCAGESQQGACAAHRAVEHAVHGACWWARAAQSWPLLCAGSSVPAARASRTVQACVSVARQQARQAHRSCMLAPQPPLLHSRTAALAHTDALSSSRRSCPR